MKLSILYDSTSDQLRSRNKSNQTQNEAIRRTARTTRWIRTIRVVPSQDNRCQSDAKIEGENKAKQIAQLPNLLPPKIKLLWRRGWELKEQTPWKWKRRNSPACCSFLQTVERDESQQFWPSDDSWRLVNSVRRGGSKFSPFYRQLESYVQKLAVIVPFCSRQR